MKTVRWHELKVGDRFRFDTHPSEVFTVERVLSDAPTAFGLRIKAIPDDPNGKLAVTIPSGWHHERETTLVMLCPPDGITRTRATFRVRDDFADRAETGDFGSVIQEHVRQCRTEDAEDATSIRFSLLELT